MCEAIVNAPSWCMIMPSSQRRSNAAPLASAKAFMSALDIIPMPS